MKRAMLEDPLAAGGGASCQARLILGNREYCTSANHSADSVYSQTLASNIASSALHRRHGYGKWSQKMFRNRAIIFALCVWVIQGGNVIVQLSGVARRICCGKAFILLRDIKMSGGTLSRVKPCFSYSW